MDEHDVSSLFGSDQTKATNTESLRLFSMKNLKSAREAFEKEYIQRKMIQLNHDIKKAADAIGVKTEYLKKNL